MFLNKVNRQQCKRYATSGKGKLCKFHLDVTNEVRSQVSNPEGPDPSGVNTLRKSAVATTLVKRAQTATGFVIDVQARTALGKLRNPDAFNSSVDPKLVLLDSVQSAWRQRQVWEAMLASVPEADFELIGQPPIPGSVRSSRGARIEVIQKMLSEATKVAARTSKLAIDAGIEERLVRLAEEQAALIADTVRAGILVALASVAKELGLSATQAASATERALQTAAGHLRLLEAGGPEIVEGVSQIVEAPSKAHHSKAKLAVANQDH